MRMTCEYDMVMRPRSNASWKRARVMVLSRGAFRFAIGDQFDADHQTASAHVSDKTVFFLQLLQRGEHQRSDSG